MSVDNSTRLIALADFLSYKTKKDGQEYDYTVTAEGKTGLQLNVYRIVDADRSLMFNGPMTSDKGVRSSDLFYVRSPNATYHLEFFM